jgi:ribosomal protein S18 acetylase RimI-like enzyme
VARKVESGHTAYEGIVPADFLAGLSVEKRTKTWEQQLKDERTVVLIAEVDGDVVGWISGGRSRDDDGAEDSEVYAIYVLSPRQHKGIGRELMSRAETKMSDARSFTVWVLQANRSAIRFYESLGYTADGARKPVKLGDKELVEVRYRKTGRTEM